jgi:DNA transformation protein
MTARRFFGGWQLLAGNTQCAIVMSGTLFFRVDDALRAELERLGCRPFRYTKQGEQVSVPKYMSAPDEVLDDPGLLGHWVRRVLAAA